MNILSAFALALFLSSAAVGVFLVGLTVGLPSWAGTLRFIGAAGMVFWASGRLWGVIEGASVTPLQLFAHVCLSVYAFGATLELWRELAHPLPRKRILR